MVPETKCSVVGIEDGVDVDVVNSGIPTAAPCSNRSQDNRQSSSVLGESLVSDLDVEIEALQYIAGLLVKDVLHTLPPRSIRRIPSCLRSLLQECCNIPLRKIEEDPSNDAWWKLLLLFPRMLLQPHARGGKVGKRG